MEFEVYGEQFSTIGGAKRVIGVDDIVVAGGTLLTALKDDFCLCSIDEKLTAERLGMEADYTDPFCVKFVQKKSATAIEKE